MGVSSPMSATISRPYLEIGANGLSLTSLPLMIGMYSSSSSGSIRMMRVLAWPRSPSRIMSCRPRMAFWIWGMTVRS